MDAFNYANNLVGYVIQYYNKYGNFVLPGKGYFRIAMLARRTISDLILSGVRAGAFGPMYNAHIIAPLLVTSEAIRRQNLHFRFPHSKTIPIMRSFAEESRIKRRYEVYEKYGEEDERDEEDSDRYVPNISSLLQAGKQSVHTLYNLRQYKPYNLAVNLSQRALSGPILRIDDEFNSKQRLVGSLANSSLRFALGPLRSAATPFSQSRIKPRSSPVMPVRMPEVPNVASWSTKMVPFAESETTRRSNRHWLGPVYVAAHHDKLRYVDVISAISRSLRVTVSAAATNTTTADVTSSTSGDTTLSTPASPDASSQTDFGVMPVTLTSSTYAPISLTAANKIPLLGNYTGATNFIPHAAIAAATSAAATVGAATTAIAAAAAPATTLSSSFALGAAVHLGNSRNPRVAGYKEIQSVWHHVSRLLSHLPIVDQVFRRAYGVTESGVGSGLYRANTLSRTLPILADLFSIHQGAIHSTTSLAPNHRVPQDTKGGADSDFLDTSQTPNTISKGEGLKFQERYGSLVSNRHIELEQGIIGNLPRWAQFVRNGTSGSPKWAMAGPRSYMSQRFFYNSISDKVQRIHTKHNVMLQNLKEKPKVLDSYLPKLSLGFQPFFSENYRNSKFLGAGSVTDLLQERMNLESRTDYFKNVVIDQNFQRSASLGVKTTGESKYPSSRQTPKRPMLASDYVVGLAESYPGLRKEMLWLLVYTGINTGRGVGGSPSQVRNIHETKQPQEGEPLSMEREKIKVYDLDPTMARPVGHPIYSEVGANGSYPLTQIDDAIYSRRVASTDDLSKVNPIAYQARGDPTAAYTDGLRTMDQGGMTDVPNLRDTISKIFSTDIARYLHSEITTPHAIEQGELYSEVETELRKILRDELRRYGLDA